MITLQAWNIAWFSLSFSWQIQTHLESLMEKVSTIGAWRLLIVSFRSSSRNCWVRTSASATKSKNVWKYVLTSTINYLARLTSVVLVPHQGYKQFLVWPPLLGRAKYNLQTAKGSPSTIGVLWNPTEFFLGYWDATGCISHHPRGFPFAGWRNFTCRHVTISTTFWLLGHDVAQISKNDIIHSGFQTRAMASCWWSAKSPFTRWNDCSWTNVHLNV